MRPFARGAALAPGVRVIGHRHRSHVLDVYDAWSAPRACRVVVKVLRPDRLRDRGAARALLREGRLLKRLGHPGLVRAYAVVDGERPAVVLETLGGETLAHLVARSRPAAADAAAVLGVQLACTLAYLHGEGVLHLDLKPSNVIVEHGRAKLLDLSIARAPGRARGGRGTWTTMAPEQVRGGRLDAAADVFALGAVLHEVLTGESPFEALGDEHEYPTLTARAAPLVRLRPRLDRRVTVLVDAMLAPDPADRPALPDVVAVLSAVGGPPDAPAPPTRADGG